MLCYFNLNQNAKHLPSGNSNAQYAPTYSCGCSLVVAMLIAACLIHHAPIGSCSENKEKKKRTNIRSSWGATPITVQPRTAYNSPAVRLKLVRDQQKKKLKIHICVNTWKLWLGINCSLLKGDTLVRNHWRWLPTVKCSQKKKNSMFPHPGLFVHLVLEVAEGPANFCHTLSLSVTPQRPRLLLWYTGTHKQV